MAKSKKDKAIVQACIDLARGSGMQVVAEGVEDETTAQTLKEMGCGILQGYWFGEPLRIEDFEQNHGLRTIDEPDYSNPDSTPRQKPRVK